jgi:hypothetical protein
VPQSQLAHHATCLVEHHNLNNIGDLLVQLIHHCDRITELHIAEMWACDVVRSGLARQLAETLPANCAIVLFSRALLDPKAAALVRLLLRASPPERTVVVYLNTEHADEEVCGCLLWRQLQAEPRVHLRITSTPMAHSMFHACSSPVPSFQDAMRMLQAINPDLHELWSPA